MQAALRIACTARSSLRCRAVAPSALSTTCRSSLSAFTPSLSRSQSHGDRRPFDGKRPQRPRFSAKQDRRTPSSTDKGFSLDKLADELSDEEAGVQITQAPVAVIPKTMSSETTITFPGQTSQSALIDVVIDADGEVTRISGASSVSSSPAASMSEEQQRQAIKDFLYYRRNLRATYDSDDFEEYTAAAAREIGSDIDDESLYDVIREDDYAIGDDPLMKKDLPFDIRQVKFTTFMSLDAAPNAKRIDRRASLKCFVGRLGLEPAVAQYVKAIAGTRYNPRNDLLYISSDNHPDAAANRRKVFEQLVTLIQESKTLTAKFGSFQKEVRFPEYRA